MTDQLVAGAPVVHPGRLDGTGPIHLGRTEARKRSDPAVVGICPGTVGRELTRVVRRRWWQRRPAWCPACAQLRDYLRGRGEL